jgi:hypothetical protein
MAIHDRNFYKSIIKKMLNSGFTEYKENSYSYTLYYSSYTNFYTLYYTAPNETHWNCAAIEANEI